MFSFQILIQLKARQSNLIIAPELSQIIFEIPLKIVSVSAKLRKKKR